MEEGVEGGEQLSLPQTCLADAMLGKLSRWLRVLGVDVVGADKVGLEDSKLLEVARREGRILLTKDEQLFRRARKIGVSAVLVLGVTTEEELAELSLKLGFKLRIDPRISRCPECNSELEELLSTEVNVPEEVKKRHIFIYRCVNCGKTFWMGSHYINMLRALARARRIREGLSSR